MKVAVCLLLCLCALEIDFSSSYGRHGPHGAGRGNRCRPHHRRHRYRHGQDDPCVDDQGGNTNELGNGGVDNNLPKHNNNGMFGGNVETSSPSTGGLRPEYNGHGNVEPFSPTGGRGPEYPTYGNRQPFIPSTGGRTPEYNRNDNVDPFSQTGGRTPGYDRHGIVESSSPPTGLREPDTRTNGTVVPVPNGRRIIQVGANCPAGYRGDNRGNCRPDF